ncbi:DUF6448 family protein [Mesorhizobium sp. A623]
MIIAVAIVVFAFVVLYPQQASAHCDTMDGPTAKDGKLALESKNLNYALKWIEAGGAEELRKIFDQSIKVRALGPDARDLADQYFLESLVRIHRAGEGAPFEGLKPSGVPVDEKISAADKSIETGDLAPLAKLMTSELVPELEKRFVKVLKLKDYDSDNVDAGRAYVQAYVSFFKFAEGEDHDHGHHHGHGAHHH